MGRAVPKKGFDDCIIAARHLADTGLNFEWQIIADGPQLKYLKALAAEYAVASRVTFLGFQSVSRVIEAMRMSDVFVLPSKLATDGDSDGIPVVLMEAMANHLPVITTAVGGIPELVIDGETGLVVPQNSSTEISTAVRRLVDDDHLREQLIRAAFLHVSEAFNCSREAAKLLRLVDSVVGDSCSSRVSERPQDC
ncbi:glycosyltransferase [Pseudonocardia sp. RS11V-5]|nr:glycosyltransferase [Pseudonocardia terrae]